MNIKQCIPCRERRSNCCPGWCRTTEGNHFLACLASSWCCCGAFHYILCLNLSVTFNQLLKSLKISICKNHVYTFQYSLAYACLKLVNYSFFFWLPFYLHAHYGWQESVADELSAWYDIGGIIAAVVAGIVSVSFEFSPFYNRTWTNCLQNKNLRILY